MDEDRRVVWRFDDTKTVVSVVSVDGGHCYLLLQDDRLIGEFATLGALLACDLLDDPSPHGATAGAPVRDARPSGTSDGAAATRGTPLLTVS